MILILTGDDDLHADSVQAELERRGAEAVRFDPAWFPAKAALSIVVRAGGVLGGQLRFQDREVELDRVETVWRRRPGRPGACPSRTDAATRIVVEDEAEAVLADLWELLDARHVPASRDVVKHAEHKSRQLLLAGRLGFELPATLVTNCPDTFLDFYGEHRGSVVTKRATPGQGLVAADGETLVRYTDPVRPRDLVHAEDLRLCPVVVQGYVPKQLELRVTVVGDRVFTAAIHSQASNHTRFDWRRYDNARTPIEPFELPDHVSKRCRALVRQLGLQYGAIDLVLTPDDRYVFLEINPNGQYLWIEWATGLEISAALADLLLDATRLPRPAGAPIGQGAEKC